MIIQTVYRTRITIITAYKKCAWNLLSKMALCWLQSYSRWKKEVLLMKDLLSRHLQNRLTSGTCEMDISGNTEVGTDLLLSCKSLPIIIRWLTRRHDIYYSNAVELSVLITKANITFTFVRHAGSRDKAIAFSIAHSREAKHIVLSGTCASE